MTVNENTQLHIDQVPKPFSSQVVFYRKSASWIEADVRLSRIVDCCLSYKSASGIECASILKALLGYPEQVASEGAHSGYPRNAFGIEAHLG